MTTNGQTIDNYKEVSDTFNKAGTQCKERGLKFGYHNHAYEFDTVDGQVLFDVLIKNTDPAVVNLQNWIWVGWSQRVKKPEDYFNNIRAGFHYGT